MSCANETGCLTLTWKIENFSIIFSSCRATMRLPAWKVETTDGNELWMMYVSKLEDSFSLELYNCTNKKTFDLCEICLISTNGEVPLENYLAIFGGYIFNFEKKLILGDDQQSILPQDTLTLCLRMRKETITNGEYCIRTILYKDSFYWPLENHDTSLGSISTKYFERHNLAFQVTLEIKRKDGTYCSVLLEGILSTEGSPIICSCIFSVKGETNNSFYGVFNEYHTNCEGKFKICPRNNTISMQIQMDCILAVHKQFEVVNGPSSSLSYDLLRMYKESIYSDATLNAKKKSYRVHRNILAARSSVFRAMFEKDQMTEARSGVVDIDDIDSGTIDRMLTFMYGDSVEDLKLEEASALYYAADKYAIHPLKEKCFSILKHGLTVSNACEALILADAHSDEKLMRFVMDFDCDHKEVVSSTEWTELQDSNPRLTSKIASELFLKKVW